MGGGLLRRRPDHEGRVETALLSKLADVQAYVAAGDKANAIGTLGAFENAVKAQTGKSIDASAAKTLLADADAEAVIGSLKS